jgi:hypothetical protein
MAATAVLVACDTGDGRGLRPARPDQNESISVPPPSSTVPVPDAESTLDPVTLPGTGVSSSKVGAPWVDGATIDVRFTCDGENVSPSISWPAAPEGTASIGVAMVDDDAPDFVHWALAGIDPERVSLAEAETPAGAIRGTNGAGEAGYTGPCPPNGEQHTYRIIVFYLSGELTLGDGAPGAQMVEALTAGSFESTSVSGIYRRAGA